MLQPHKIVDVLFSIKVDGNKVALKALVKTTAVENQFHVVSISFVDADDQAPIMENVILEKKENKYQWSHTKSPTNKLIAESLGTAIEKKLKK